MNTSINKKVNKSNTYMESVNNSFTFSIADKKLGLESLDKKSDVGNWNKIKNLVIK
jgi:hypothetical protein